MLAIVQPSTSLRLALTTSDQSVGTLVSGKIYRIDTNQDCYIRQDGTAASAAAGSTFVPKGSSVFVAGANGTALHAIGLVAGDLTCTQIDTVGR